MWKNKLSLIFFLFLSSFSIASLKLDFQVYDESSSDNLAGLLTTFSLFTKRNFRFSGGARLLSSASELDRFEYKIDTQWMPLSWVSLHLRAAHRVKLPADFSDSTLMPRLELHSSWGIFSFFLSGGFYYRWVSLSQGSFLPFSQATDFTDRDFSTDFGIVTKITSQISWLNRVSTFDEVETFNLNHPFIESALIWQKSPKSLSWGITSRYQMLLGFGRLDRLMLGAFVSTPY